MNPQDEVDLARGRYLSFLRGVVDSDTLNGLTMNPQDEVDLARGRYLSFLHGVVDSDTQKA